MDLHNTMPHPNKKRMMHTVLSLLVIGVAVAVLIYMVAVEGEPGALPLLLLVLGIGWLAIARFSMPPETVGRRSP